jgi:NAD(P)-dependent dehydrogenase (short-subunit alcohol dehydrogenase family)
MRGRDDDGTGRGTTRFRGRVVVITGAASGIGKEMALGFAAEGAFVVVVDLDQAKIDETVADLEGGFGRVTDVTDRNQVAGLVAEVEDRYGRLDVLINNATVCTDTPFTELSEEQWDREVDVNMKGCFTCSQAVLTGMVGRGGGVIVNIASVNGIGYFGNDAYSAAKAGVLSLTRSVAVRYGPFGVRSNAVVPGTIQTPQWDDRLAADPDALDKMARWYPLGRVGQPSDVVPAVMFLASDEAAWITGAALPVDGGLLAGNLRMTQEMGS